MPLGLLGKKLGSTRVYNASGVLIPVTVVLAGPNRVLQVKTQAGKDGYNAVQLGFDDQKEQRVTKPLLGHIKKHNGAAVKRIREFRNFSKEVKPGDVVGPALFAPGDFVDAIGITKGRGFEGVMKRHGFRRRPFVARAKRLGPPRRCDWPAPVSRHRHARPENARPHGPGPTHDAKPGSDSSARGGQFVAHQRRDSRFGGRLRCHPRIEETAQGLETAGERRADETEGRRTQESRTQARRGQEIISRL